jgi:hypothetical protein
LFNLQIRSMEKIQSLFNQQIALKRGYVPCVIRVWFCKQGKSRSLKNTGLKLQAYCPCVRVGISGDQYSFGQFCSQQFLCVDEKNVGSPSTAAADGSCTKAFNFFQLLICKFRSVGAAALFVQIRL